MSEANCTDPLLGRLLHAYELGALTPEDSERFEIHLLSCEHCFGEVRRLDSETLLLAKDHNIRQAVQAETKLSEGKKTAGNWWRDYLWPETPFLFRPALIWVLVLALLYPAYLGLRPASQPLGGPVFSIALYPSRSVEEKIILPRDRNILVSFLVDDVQKGAEYQVKITDQNGNLIFRDGAFRDFDNYQTGRILVPRDRLRTGGYTLTVSPIGDTLITIQEFFFTVESN